MSKPARRGQISKQELKDFNVVVSEDVERMLSLRKFVDEIKLSDINESNFINVTDQSPVPPSHALSAPQGQEQL
jgi:hypothetical protein